MSLLRQISSCVIGLALSLSAGAPAAEVVAVVSTESAITSLSSHQLVDIFLGKLSRFSDGVQAIPIDQAEDSKTRGEFYEQFAGRSPAQIKAHWARIIFTGRGQPPVAVSNSVEVKKLLAEKRHAIGYIDRKAVDDSVRVVVIR